MQTTEELIKELKATGRLAELKEHLRSKQPLFGSDSPFSHLLQQLVNEMLEGEMDDFLAGQTSAESKPGNKRNGKTTKAVLSPQGRLHVTTPRDRLGQFSPELVAKRQRTLSSGLDEQIMALYAQGNSIEDVRRLLEQLYGVQVSAGKLSAITDRVLPRIQAWQSRQLQSFYPVVYLDAIHFKVRYEGRYESRACYTVYAVDFEGQRDLLGLYVQGSEGATRWGLVLEDLRQRGCEDILVVCTDNLTGFSEVIDQVFPAAVVQKCVVHQVRNSLRFVSDKDRKAVARDLRQVYTAKTLQQAGAALEVFDQQWSRAYGYITQQWRQHWEELTAYFSFSSPLRRMIYTTNPVEALHRIMRKLIKSKAAWVSDTALIKQLFMSLMYNEKSWRRRAYHWKVIQRELLEKYPERVQAAMK